MVGQQQGGDGLVGRQHVANFHAQDLEHAVGWRRNFHFAQLGIQFGQLGAGLSKALGPCAGQKQVVTALRGSHILVQDARAG